MYRTYSKTKRMLNEEKQGESRVREIRTHGLVDEVNPIIRNSLRIREFTLIELVALLAIMILVTGVVVGNVGRIPAFLSLENTVQRIEYLFSKASMMAMAQGRNVTVSYQPGGKVFSISPSGSSSDGEFSGKFLSEKIPEAVNVEFDSEEPNYIFFPDGSGFGTSFSLTLKGHTFRLRISSLTGVAIVEKVD